MKNLHMKTQTCTRILAILAVLLVALPGWSQTLTPLTTIWNSVSVPVTTTTRDSDSMPSTGVQQLLVQWTFGTVSGSYSACTVRVKTTFDNGSNWLTIGAATSITVASSQVNSWMITGGNSATSSATVAPTFGRLSKLTFACSSYGTTAPGTVTILGQSIPVSTGGGGGGGAVTVADGADTTQGTQADTACTSTDATPCTVVGLLKEISAKEQSPASRAVTAASGALASGSIASGALASGAVASGAFASGALAAGAISNGADVAEGSTTVDRCTTTDTTACTIVGLMKQNNYLLNTPTGQQTMANSNSVTIASNQGAIPVSVASGGIASGGIASGAVASGAYVAGSIADGAEVTLGTKTDAKSTATDGTSTSAISILKEISAMEQAPASRAVTNAGTFATQSAITAASGSVASGALASGSVSSGAIASGAYAAGSLNSAIPDPCFYTAKTAYPINISSATTTVVQAASASNKFRICSMFLFASAAENVALVEDATGSCASPDAGIMGGTTTGAGINLAANQGWTLGDGLGTVAQTASTNVNVCLITSSTAQLSGTIMGVLVP